MDSEGFFGEGLSCCWVFFLWASLFWSGCGHEGRDKFAIRFGSEYRMMRGRNATTMNVTHCLLRLSGHLFYTDSLRDLTANHDNSWGYVLSTDPSVLAVPSETVADDPRRRLMYGVASVGSCCGSPHQAAQSSQIAYTCTNKSCNQPPTTPSTSPSQA